MTTCILFGNVATIGTFDLLHQGHLELFRFCNELSSQIPGSRVIVGVNTDGFIFRYKGQLPILSFRERASLVDACKYVSESSANPQDGLGVHSVRSFLERHEVRYLVVGSDWVDRDYLGQIGMTRSELEELNVILNFKPYHPGISATDIRTRIAMRSKAKLKPKGHGTLVVAPVG